MGRWSLLNPCPKKIPAQIERTNTVPSPITIERRAITRERRHTHRERMTEVFILLTKERCGIGIYRNPTGNLRDSGNLRNPEARRRNKAAQWTIRGGFRGGSFGIQPGQGELGPKSHFLPQYTTFSQVDSDP